MAPPPPAKPAGHLKHDSGISKKATLSKESLPRIYSPSKKFHADFVAIHSSKSESDELSKSTSKSGSRSVMASESNALDRTGDMMESNSKIPLFSPAIFWQ
jgi:hypothetical protein